MSFVREMHHGRSFQHPPLTFDASSGAERNHLMLRNMEYMPFTEPQPGQSSTQPNSKPISKQRRIPAPIKIYSSTSGFDVVDSPSALPFSTTPKSSRRINTPQRAAPTPPLDRSSSILVLSPPNSARRIPTPTTHASRYHHSQSKNSREAKNVRFAVLKSPACSNLRSPAYFTDPRESLSPMPYSPKTPDAMSFEDPDIILESPIEDAPMLSITPFEETILAREEKEREILSLPEMARGRQCDRETFLRLTGREPSPSTLDRDPRPLASIMSDGDDGIVQVQHEHEMSESTERRRFVEPAREVHEKHEGKMHAKSRASAPASKPKGYLPKTSRTDQQSILSAYFSPAFRPVSY